MWCENAYIQCVLITLSTIAYISINAYTTFYTKKENKNGTIKPIYINGNLEEGDFIDLDGTIRNIKDLK